MSAGDYTCSVTLVGPRGHRLTVTLTPPEHDEVAKFVKQQMERAEPPATAKPIERDAMRGHRGYMS